MTGEVAVLEWIRDRIAGSLTETRRGELDTDLRALRSVAGAGAGGVRAAADLAARAAARLRSP